ncbi:GTPase Era [bacterium]|nr:MAG: GTPase Era [bacterium]
MAYKAGYVALVGKPNVGKSTLTNRIVGQKVSIVSNKPQTTRRRVLGITTTPEWQIAFIDTPGIHEPHTALGKTMVDQARASFTELDVLVYVADGSHFPGDGDKAIARMLEDVKGVPRLVCMNKMDQLRAEDVVRNVEAYCELLGTPDYMLTTATRGDNVDDLVAMIVERLPERAPMYDDDAFTDQSTRFLTSELVREKILIATRQEVPHAVAVMVESWEEENDIVHIDAVILVEKASQRGILIGKGGQFIKTVGQKAREEIEPLLGRKIFLTLQVKVAEGWRMNPRIVHELSYDI